MAEVDTSSYPKPQAVRSVADAVKDIAGLQQQKQQIESGGITIEKQKLDLLNQRFGYLAKSLTQLSADPNLNEDKIRKTTEDLVKLGYIPNDMGAKFIGTLPPTQGMDPKQASSVLRQATQGALQQAQTTQEAINFHYGQPGTISNNQQIQPVVSSPKFGVRATNAPIQMQNPPNTTVYDENNQPTYLGPQSPQAPQGTAAAPPMRSDLAGTTQAAPTPRPRPQGLSGAVEQPTKQRVDLEGTETKPSAFNDRFAPAQAYPLKAGPSPMLDSGIKQLTSDQENATAKMTQAKPAIQALRIIGRGGLATGPGTGKWNDLVAAAKAWGVVNTAAENDPTVLRQELEKKLAQYVGNSPIASRSDAAQTLAEAGSPNPNKQILPALEALTRDAIILDRVQAARPNAFESKNPAEYGKFRATFPQSIDERAFGLDLMPEKERVKLVTTMHNKYKNNPKNPEAVKFFKSLDVAKKQGFFEGNE